MAILLSSTLSITLSSFQPPWIPLSHLFVTPLLWGWGRWWRATKQRRRVGRYIRGKKEKLGERFFFLSFSYLLASHFLESWLVSFLLRSLPFRFFGLVVVVVFVVAVVALRCCLIFCLLFTLLFSLLLRSTHCSSRVSECYTKRGFYCAHAHLDDTLSDLAHVRSQIHAAVITWEGCTGKSVQVKLMYLTFDIWIIQSSFAGRWTRTLDRGRRRHVGLPWFISRISLFRIFKRVFY